ncbi:oxidoreductase FAD/NAD(P)-binding protein [Rhizoctonia solani]|uniref:Oxidoreductase FAD/NAD(P)-binding protein n=1 Tax=Rhizoctonia solani TaxID=456999 RepID=A0A8H8P060_9AGAM|nr:oxidoreductase FAD/NAD(P)-binding protein [Rhizoctonia solani]QRW23296.1 oxidoreductase FAD/NAD(P)-binding protein [Rhizoctonia solani]
MFEEATTGVLGWHPGEHWMQSKLDVAQAVRFAYTAVRDHLPLQHRTFHTSNIAFVPLTTLDSDGRPWVSLIASKDGKVGFVQSPSEIELIINGDVWDGDPARKNLEKGKGKLVAGLGIEWATRRRNKFAGVIRDVEWDENGKMRLDMKVTQTLGNCPKYINVRTVGSSSTAPHVVYNKTDLGPEERLPDELIDFIHRADTIFIGTTYVADQKHEETFPSHVGTNHRGGRAGFVRVRKDGLTLVLPDYSGNRFYNSLGNVHATPLAGITILDFVTGNMLYVTGRAQNVFDQSAREIMDRTDLLTLVTTTGYTFVKNAMPVRQIPGTPVVPSPYSPPVRYLVEEKPSAKVDSGTTLLLERIQLHSPDLATFSFAPSTPVEVKPGQAAIIDMTSFIGKREYAHMARQAGEEKLLNDDGIRTWTVSGQSPTGAVQLTIREKQGGYVTSRLFTIAKKMEQMMPGLLEDTRPVGMQVSLVGVDGDFILPLEGKKLLWVAGGVGITPFLAMLKGTARTEEKWDVVLALATRRVDVEAFGRLVSDALTEAHSASLNLRVVIYSNGLRSDFPVDFGTSPDGSKVPVTIRSSRITKEDLATEGMDAEGREVYVCGPLEMEELVVLGLQEVGIDPRSQTKTRGVLSDDWDCLAVNCEIVNWQYYPGITSVPKVRRSILLPAYHGVDYIIEFEDILDKIADTNMVDTEWDDLRDMIKYKLVQNALEFISDAEQTAATAPPPPSSDAPFVPLTDSSDLMSTDGPLPPDAPPPPSPSPPYLVSPLATLDLQPSTPMGLVIAPFPARPNLELHGAGLNGNGAVWDTSSGRALPAKLDTEETKEELGRIFAYLHDFDSAPPFTVQRLVELVVKPRGHYKNVGKYLRALERTLLVTSTHKDYPLDTYALEAPNGTQPAIGRSASSRASTPAPLDIARSPLFTPIPFLHRPAPGSNHRSLSRSPPPTSPRAPLPGDAPGDANMAGVPTITPEDSIPALGLVDELDDPRPGHLSDHPTALSSVTQLPPESLGDRFVSVGQATGQGQPETGNGAEGGLNVPQSNSEPVQPPPQTQPTVREAEGYVRASSPEPSPTRILAEEAREHGLEAIAGAKPTEGSPKSEAAKDAAKEEPLAGTTEQGSEDKKSGERQMSVDEPDENKENVPS